MEFDQQGNASVYRFNYLTFSPSSGLSALIVIANSAMAAVSAFWSPAIIFWFSSARVSSPSDNPGILIFGRWVFSYLRLRPLHWIGMVLLTSNPLQGVVEGSNLFISLQSVRKVYVRLRKQKTV